MNCVKMINIRDCKSTFHYNTINIVHTEEVKIMNKLLLITIYQCVRLSKHVHLKHIKTTYMTFLL